VWLQRLLIGFCQLPDFRSKAPNFQLSESAAVPHMNFLKI
jgi:hypothetical protein